MWAVPLAASLGKMVPSGKAIALEVGVAIITREEITSCGMPFQFVIPAGSRGRIRSRQQDGFSVDLPAAVHFCGNGCVLFDNMDAAAMESLVPGPASLTSK
jgi:hypothetical protein